MGGESLQDLYLVAEDAQRLYDSLFVSVEEDGFTSKPTVGIFTISSNPSRNKINIEYTLVEKSEVNLSIFDATGRFVTALVNTTQGPGSYKHTCNTANLSQGVYFVRLHTREKSIVEKVIFLR